MPAIRKVLEKITESDDYSQIKYDVHEATKFIGRSFSCVIRSEYRLVPKGEGDDRDVKQTCFNVLKLDKVVTKAALRYFRTAMAIEIATYMKRLVLLKPEIITDSD